MGDIETILQELGPARSSQVARSLQQKFGITPVTARKRLSRLRPPLRRFPVPLLPKKEAFLYHEEQRKTDLFWTNLVAALRETKSAFGAAIDGLMARGGVVEKDEFAVITGAPIALKGQVSSSRLASSLESAGAIKLATFVNVGECYICDRAEIGDVDFNDLRPRSLAEGVILDGVREWARKLGLAAFNSIAIRGENHPRLVGQFKWDVTGPSYLLRPCLARSRKLKRTKTPIEWKDGSAVAEIAKTGKEKAIGKALNEHFLNHPLAN